jgi:glycolate oxidase
LKTQKTFQAIETCDLEHFRNLVPEAAIFSDAENLEKYGHDETEDYQFPPQLVLKPASADEVSKILAYCNKRSIAVTASGARTGLSGGALPLYGGVALSTENLNRIISIDERNLQATVEPGVINQIFHEACKEKGLFYPPDPSSWGSSFIGGNLALNAGGPKAVKYGVTNAYVLDLQVVLADGAIINTGARVLKNSTGYNLTQLMVGSEGTCEAVSAIFQAGITPSGMEFMERDAIDYALKFIDNVELPIGEDVQAHLLIEVDGNYPETLMQDCEAIADIVMNFGASEPLFADNDKDKASLWTLRRRVGEAVKSHSIYKEEDTVVPRAELANLLRSVKALGAKYGFKSVCYGHAGDGNLHVNILKEEMSDKAWAEDLPKAIRELFAVVKALGGTISGEHGIGYVQKEYMDIVFNSVELNLQKEIKKVFDPQGILNPGKVFPE